VKKKERKKQAELIALWQFRGFWVLFAETADQVGAELHVSGVILSRATIII